MNGQRQIATGRMNTRPIVPRNTAVTHALTKARNPRGIIFRKSLGAAHRAIYAPTEKTKAKSKAKITLPKITFTGGDE
jgi:hypothetical protein